ncbi:hypothetical protein ZOSMA_129G00260 [Zostera marina]|uniref:BLOC-1-related complex subunit 6 C-terminal helix domain-containing protein n=1 Tax=Zostera marina TaxID=29655 RepID=A0A0K9PZD7_ZOSMR|nr:hypothetical protein ZOSMA_129G00260 [Zostera marina]
MTTEEISASCGSDIPEDLAIKDDIPIESPQNQRDSDDLSMDPSDIIKALEVVERDSVAIAENFASLFSSLRSSLSEASSSSVEHMQCFNDVVGRLQESVLDASTKGNRYINSCLRLNEELKGMESLAMQIKFLRKNVDALDLAVNRAVRF